MSFCVAGAALCDIPTSLITLHTPPFTLHTRHFTSPHFTLHTVHFTLLLHTWHFPPYTSHFTLHTLHSTLYTPHFTLYTLHSTLPFPLHTPHSTLHILHFTPYTLHSALHTRHFTLYTLHSALYTLHSTLYTPHCTLHTLLHTVHPPLSTSHFTLYVSHVRFGSWRLDFVAVLFVRLLWFYQFLLLWNLNDLNILISNSSLQNRQRGRKHLGSVQMLLLSDVSGLLSCCQFWCFTQFGSPDFCCQILAVLSFKSSINIHSSGQNIRRSLRHSSETVSSLTFSELQ